MLTALDHVGAPIVGAGRVRRVLAFPHGGGPGRSAEGRDIVPLDLAVRRVTSRINTRTTNPASPLHDRPRSNLNAARRMPRLAAAQVGQSCESDAAARKVLTDAGFGPDYRLPGLPHRTGHGIGMDGHEWTYFVRGNKTPIAPGMCFSDEPMIAIYGEFGIRLEDCLYITEEGPRFFSTQSVAIDRPFG
jgi:Xaa-Pro dipeptidase